MKIELHEIPIKDIVKGYVDNQEEGVLGYDGALLTLISFSFTSKS